MSAAEGSALQVDYLIVGAGAAGCALGWLLAQSGARVLTAELLDAAQKSKLCGGAMAGSGIAELRAIFGERALDELCFTYSHTLKMRCVDREVSSPISFATIERKQLDDWLLRTYLSAGGELLDRMRLARIDEGARTAVFEDLRTHAPVEVRYGALIGADGAASSVRRMLTGRRQRIVVALEGEAPLVQSEMLFCHQAGTTGYSWYIPASDTANVGCMIYGGTAVACRQWIGLLCRELGIPVPALRGAPFPQATIFSSKPGRMRGSSATRRGSSGPPTEGAWNRLSHRRGRSPQRFSAACPTRRVCSPCFAYSHKWPKSVTGRISSGPFASPKWAARSNGHRPSTPRKLGATPCAHNAPLGK